MVPANLRSGSNFETRLPAYSRLDLENAPIEMCTVSLLNGSETCFALCYLLKARMYARKVALAAVDKQQWKILYGAHGQLGLANCKI